MSNSATISGTFTEATLPVEMRTMCKYPGFLFADAVKGIEVGCKGVVVVVVGIDLSSIVVLRRWKVWEVGGGQGTKSMQNNHVNDEKFTKWL